jgi:hypothetical protein
MPEGNAPFGRARFKAAEEPFSDTMVARHGDFRLEDAFICCRSNLLAVERNP